jgi:multisubunit Na+/H+ antiporter MnhE subunit
MADDHGPRGGGGAAGARRAWLLWWVLLTGLWLALADSRRLEEVVAGILVGAFGATAAILVRAQRDVVLRPRPRWILEALLPPLARWPRDLWALARALVARPRGRIVEEPFAATGEDPRSAARRALAVAGGTLAPNAIVVEIDAERGVLVRHVLVEDER